MKRVTGAVISLFFLVFMVQVAGAADVQMNGSVGVSGAVSATSFSGSGSGLTNLNPGNITSGIANIDISGNAATATTAGTANSVATGGVNTSGIVDGAVTAGKIAFLGKVAIVATIGGNYDNPATAMSDYASWCRIPLASTPCLLKIMPGVYDIGSSPVVMQPHIDIEGSGENTTIITGNPDGDGTIDGASNAEIRLLTVENTGGGNFAIAIQNVNGASPKITNVTAIASGAVNNIGINVYSSSPTLTNVTAEAESAGTYNNGVVNNTNAATVMQNVTASAKGGTNDDGVYNTGSPSVVMRNVTAAASGGTVSNGVFNDSSSVLMDNVDATASDGATNNGVMNQASGANMVNIRATATGGSQSNGVFNQNCSSQVRMHNVEASASGASGFSTAIRNLNSTVEVRLCTAVAKDSVSSVKNGIFDDGSTVNLSSSVVVGTGGDCSSGCFGVYNTTSGQVNVDSSVVYGSTNAAYNNTSVTMNVGNTQLGGSSVYNAGTLKCIGAYDNSYNALGVNCL
jgi:hypothetical protein